MAKEVCFAEPSVCCPSTTMLGGVVVCSIFVSSGCDRGTMTRCRNEKSTCGQGGGIGNGRPMSAIDSSDAPARSSDSRREAWGDAASAATGSALDRRSGRISRAQGGLVMRRNEGRSGDRARAGMSARSYYTRCWYSVHATQSFEALRASSRGKARADMIYTSLSSGRGGGGLGKPWGSWGCFGGGLETEKRLIAGGRFDAQDCSHRQICEYVSLRRACGGPVGRKSEDCCFCCPPAQSQWAARP